MNVRYFSYDELPEAARHPVPIERAVVPHGYEFTGSGGGKRFYRDPSTNAAGPQPEDDPRTRYFREMGEDGHNPALGVLMRYERDGPDGFRFTEEGRLEAMKKFAAAYAEHGTIRAGCRAAQVNRYTAAYWVKRYPKFMELMEDARLDYNDSLMEEVDRRARKGIIRRHVVSYQGVISDEWEEREFSDLLLMFQTKSRMPQYRDRVQEMPKDSGINYSKLEELLDKADKVQVGGNTNTPAQDYTPASTSTPSVEVEVDADAEPSYRWRDDPVDRER